MGCLESDACGQFLVTVGSGASDIVSVRPYCSSSLVFISGRISCELGGGNVNKYGYGTNCPLDNVYGEMYNVGSVVFLLGQLF